MIVIMTNLSEQKIIVCCDFTESMNDAIVHGARIAGIFRKELCLFCPVVSRKKKEKQEIQKKLEKVIRDLKDQVSDLSVSSLTLNGDLIDSVERLAEDFDGIMIIMTTEKMREKLTALRQSSVPFLFIQGISKEYLRYDRVMFPVDASKVIKDAALWATYFGRFNHADIEIFVAKGKNEEQKTLIKSNLKDVKELHSNLDLSISQRHRESSSCDLYTEAAESSLKEQFNLLIVPGWQISKTDDLFVFPELKMIRTAGKLPVLCVNPNRNMYILCD